MVDRRESDVLQPGALYRITDYVTTTAQTDTQSANHPFDVIVLALSDSVLSENAWAIQHEGDEYFAGSNLAAWQMKYCLDNDANRFLWADTDNGKGVIYYMKDERNNECPYDFKNIQFLRPASWFTEHSDWCSWSLGSVPATDIYFYTFSVKDGDSIQDMSFLSECYNNTFGPYIVSLKKQKLNNNIFATSVSSAYQFLYDNSIGIRCYDNTIAGGFANNICPGSFINNVVGRNAYSNTFAGDFRDNVLEADVQYNNFGHFFKGNTIGFACTYCSFGQSCTNNDFGGTMERTSIGDNVKYVDISVRGVINCVVLSGVQGTSAQHLAIPFAASKSYLQMAGKTTDGVLKIWNPADLA